MINVTKTFLPPFEEYMSILKRAWDKAWITNNGELSIELEAKLRSFLDVPRVLYCNNGTSVLQMALKVLEISGEVITTPFSYVATTTAILWENCKPVFVDIDEKHFCIDPQKIESAITPRTSAILATHVYGYPCDVDAIDAIAKKHHLKVIYDAAHAFGTKIKGRSLLEYGDISTCSFHATKLFHTVEGGCIVTSDEELYRKLNLYRQFGHLGDDYIMMGINAKNSEFHAAMGLCNFRYIDQILEKRKKQWIFYSDRLTATGIQTMDIPTDISFNYAYFPAVFPSEKTLINALDILKKNEIYARRYFYPALCKLPYLEHQSCPIAESIAARVICLPLYFELTEEDQCRVIEQLLKALKEG